eukprot:GILK01008372.1.p1 GENE.GILK01008372.1~~GILK01008372.1.p1  ORF type:complete len:636 (+),score=63.55 GILK01008372.1:67-1974(+)
MGLLVSRTSRVSFIKLPQPPSLPLEQIEQHDRTQYSNTRGARDNSFFVEDCLSPMSPSSPAILSPSSPYELSVLSPTSGIINVHRFAEDEGSTRAVPSTVSQEGASPLKTKSSRSFIKMSFAAVDRILSRQRTTPMRLWLTTYFVETTLYSFFAIAILLGVMYGRAYLFSEVAKNALEYELQRQIHAGTNGTYVGVVFKLIEEGSFQIDPITRWVLILDKVLAISGLSVFLLTQIWVLFGSNIGKPVLIRCVVPIILLPGMVYFLFCYFIIYDRATIAFQQIPAAAPVVLVFTIAAHLAEIYLKRQAAYVPHDSTHTPHQTAVESVTSTATTSALSSSLTSAKEIEKIKLMSERRPRPIPHLRHILSLPVSACALLALTYIDFMFPLYHLLDEEWKKILFRVLLVPIVNEIPLATCRMSARLVGEKYRHKHKSAVSVICIIGYMAISCFSRFLLANLATMEGVFIANSALLVIEVGEKLTRHHRDYFYARVFLRRSKEDAHHLIRADTQAYLPTVDTFCQKINIVVTGAWVLYLGISSAHGKPSTLAAVVTNEIIQIAMEVISDVVAIAIEEKRFKNPVVEHWRHRYREFPAVLTLGAVVFVNWTLGKVTDLMCPVMLVENREVIWFFCGLEPTN